MRVAAVAAVVAVIVAASGAPTSTPLYDQHPDLATQWSPDGRLLNVRRLDVRPPVHAPLPQLSYVLNPETGSLRRAPPEYFQWSPDGSRTAFVRGKLVYLADRDGAHARPLARGGSVAWSPDGGSVAIAGDVVAVYDIATGAKRTLTAPAAFCRPYGCSAHDVTAVWAPNGRRLAVQRDIGSSGSLGFSTVLLIDLDGHVEANLMDSVREALICCPHWSGNSRWLAVDGEDGNVRTYLVEIATGRTIDLGERYVDWSPVGERLAVTSERPGILLRASPDDPVGRRIPGVYGVSWSTDGRRIAFARGTRVMVAAPDGTDVRAVGRGQYPLLSPDGSRVAYSSAGCGSGQGLHLVSASGIRDRRLTRFCLVTAAYSRPVEGFPEAQTIVGTDSDDELHGGRGDDRLLGGTGRDRLFGDEGADALLVADGVSDRVVCGPGRDRVIADRSDDISPDCELVRRR